ncbi:hypothetical protein WJ25_24435 [Burkholderia thailandensis]|nr:hypothetical protein WJ25_24435 [Burkholderia thailandensis]
MRSAAPAHRQRRMTPSEDMRTRRSRDTFGGPRRASHERMRFKQATVTARALRTRFACRFQTVPKQDRAHPPH